MDMNAPLVREGRVAHVRQPLVGRKVRDLVHEPGHLLEMRELLWGETAHLHLDLKVGNDGTQAGVPASLAQPVDRSLHLDGPHLDRDHRIGHGHIGVIVRVDPQGNLNNLEHLGKSVPDLPGHRPPVCVA